MLQSVQHCLTHKYLTIPKQSLCFLTKTFHLYSSIHAVQIFPWRSIRRVGCQRVGFMFPGTIGSCFLSSHNFNTHIPSLPQILILNIPTFQLLQTQQSKPICVTQPSLNSLATTNLNVYHAARFRLTQTLIPGDVLVICLSS
jgi:hypothetical protein